MTLGAWNSHIAIKRLVVTPEIIELRLRHSAKTRVTGAEVL